jgi:hypothetical protein
LEETVLYEDKFINFPTDYDKENPITSKSGVLREIKLKIYEAKKTGDKKYEEELK